MNRIALIGLPNCGKSSLFNSLTGSQQKVANFPGITVERKAGVVETSVGSKVELIDLPGLYSLDARTADERLTRDFILGKKEQVDRFLFVIDSTNLKKSLYLASQLVELKLPLVVALNMEDLASKRNQVLDLKALSSFLGDANVVQTIAVEAKGVQKIIDLIDQKSFEDKRETPKNYLQLIRGVDYVKNHLGLVDRAVDKIVVTKIAKDTFTERLDSILLHPVFGILGLLLILIFTFQLLFIGADPFIGYIEAGFEIIAQMVDGLLSDGHLKDLIIDGVIAGVGAFVVFLPHIIFLFILIYLLEDFGYLGRVAFMLDFFMRKLGLPGKAVVPLLSSHACAIPGIMGARIIEDKNQRLLTMMISPLMTCSARIPVYTLLIAALFSPEHRFYGLDTRGLVMFALYMFAIVIGFVISFVTKKMSSAQSVNTLMMELPPYRVPKLKNILFSSWQKSMLFLKKAGSVIFILSIIIWLLVTFPGKKEGDLGADINYSYAAKIGKTFEPIFRPIGFDWKITTALIPSFGAREVLVSAMGTVMAVDEDDEDRLMTKLSDLMKNNYSLATLLSLLVWFIFSPQCIATFGVLRRETNGYKYPIIFGVYTLALAYGFSFITYRIFA